MKKVYRLKNGYSISKGEFYDGYDMQTRWCIYEPNGRLYMSCGSYKEAYEIASNLTNDEELEWLEEQARKDAEEIMNHKSPYSRNPLDDMDDEDDDF